ncbi:hypothetical protein ACP70R_040599 [Stipagrostis hirtigluma subsp. patula]
MRAAAEAAAVARDVASSSPSKPASVLDVMRFQRPSPDCLPLPNGINGGSASGGSRKPPPPPPPPTVPRSSTSKDDVAPAVATDSSRLAAYLASTSLEHKPRARAPPPPPPAPAPTSSSAAAAVGAIRSPARDHGNHHTSDFADPTSPSSSGAGASGSGGPAGGEVLLQWGQNKRTRGRRDAASGSAASPQRRQPPAKIQRRSSAPADKLMPPPSGPSYTRGSTLRVTSSLPARGGAAISGDAHHGRGSLPHHRSAEERAGGKSAAAAGRTEKQRADKKAEALPVMGLMVPDSKQLQQHHQSGSGGHHHADHHGGIGGPGASASTKPAAQQKVEMPRIYTTLSRKEKEEDFLAMKGTKLPQRPKKRPKAVEKAVNYICPGMWLTDVTRSKYVVREKKCTKKPEVLGPERDGEHGQRLGLIVEAARGGMPKGRGSSGGGNIRSPGSEKNGGEESRAEAVEEIGEDGAPKAKGSWGDRQVGKPKQTKRRKLFLFG